MKDAEQAEEAIKTANGNDVEKNAEAASLRAARAVDVARQVLDESDDPRYAESLAIAAKEVEKGMKPDIMSIYPRALFQAFVFCLCLSCETDDVAGGHLVEEGGRSTGEEGLAQCKQCCKSSQVNSSCVRMVV